MKKYLLIVFFCIEFVSIAQIRITGKVIDSESVPLIGAAVYLNNTSIGTTTDDNGEFELFIKQGVHDLIISYLGYETIQYKIDTNKPLKKIIFRTKETGNILEEIVLENKKYSKEDRAYFLSRFRNTFIGKTIFSQNCKILNPDVIQFHYDSETKILEAYVRKPIEILNKDLGYKIFYDLVHYELTQSKITYLGYSRYQDLKGGKSKQRKWSKNRLRAYNGSKMHFIRAARKGELRKDGFIMGLSKRILNPERPSDSILKKARKYLRSLNTKSDTSQTFKILSNKNLQLRENRKKVINQLKKKHEFKNITIKSINNLINSPAIVRKNKDGLYEANILAGLNYKRDSVLKIINKSRLKKFIDVKITDSITDGEFLTKINKDVIMMFKNYLDIKYMNEKEEFNYRRGPNRLNYQATKLILFSDSVVLDKSGVFIEPLDVFMEGYWGYEKIADALPLDYRPL